VRLVLPALFFLGMAGAISGILYSLRRFVLPSFIAAAFNASIILIALFFGAQLGIYALVIRIVVGAGMQVFLQLPGLRDAHLRPTLNWRHPILRQIVRLYVPVLLGYSVSLVGVAVDRNLVGVLRRQWLDSLDAVVHQLVHPVDVGAEAQAPAQPGQPGRVLGESAGRAGSAR